MSAIGEWQEVRLKCLELALQHHTEMPRDVIDRAKAYEAYLNGDDLKADGSHDAAGAEPRAPISRAEPAAELQQFLSRQNAEIEQTNRIISRLISALKSQLVCETES